MPVADPLYAPARSAVNYLGILVGFVVIYVIYKILKKK